MYRSRSPNREKGGGRASPSAAGASLPSSNGEVEPSRRRPVEMEQQWLDALMWSRDPILLADGDKIVFANSACADMLGVSRGRLERLHVSNLLTSAGEHTSNGYDSDEAGHFLCIEGRLHPVELQSRSVRYRGRTVRLHHLRVPACLSVQSGIETSDALVEGIWHLEPTVPLQLSGLDVDTLSGALDSSRLALCNLRMQEALRVSLGLSDQALETRHVLSFLGGRFAEVFFDADLRLNGRDCRVPCADGGVRHFKVYATIVAWNGYLIRILGSCMEITEHVEMEHRMVSALEEQREQLGRELHDGVGQLLTGVQILSGNLARNRELRVLDMRDQAGKIARMAEEAHLNVRQVYRGLSANHLRHLELAEALSDLTEFVVTMPEVEGVFQYDGCASVQDLEVKLQLYRIAQEAINNSLKHSKASRMTISWFQQGEKLVLEVVDDGRGFDADCISGKTLGLHSMQYRARLIGGELELTTSPGAGTVIRCELPDPLATANHRTTRDFLTT